MSYIIILLIVILNAGALAKIFKKKIDITMPISLMFIIFIIYVLGLFSNRLDIGVYVIDVITVVSLLYLIYRFIRSITEKNVKGFFENLTTPGLLVYVLFYALFIFLNKDRLFTLWDEFSHWGLVVKNMFTFDTFGADVPTTMTYKGYPPFTAIFQYFAQKVVNSYSEGRIIVAMNLIYISMILPIFRNIDWRKGLSKLLIYVPITFLLPLCMYNNFYTTIYIDATLGIFMAYILYTYFSLENDKVKNISVCLGLASLPLIKSAGSGLAIFVIAIILADIIFKYKKCNVDKKIFHKNIILLLIYILTFIVSKYSWDIHLSMAGIGEAWNTEGVSLNNITALLSGNSPAYMYTVIRNFVMQFLTEPIDFGVGQLTNLASLMIFVIYSIYAIYLVHRNKKDNTYKRYILAELMLIICYIIYMISLLILYLFTFSEYEALRLASYTRYSYIPLIGMFLFSTFIILDNLFTIKQDKVNFLILAIVILLIMPIKSVGSLLLKNEASINTAITTREKYKDISKYASILESDDLVYYISCGSNGYDVNIANYEIIPIKIWSTVGYSLGPARYEGDIWSKDTSLEKLEQELIKRKYTHVYIFKADEIFKDKYFQLFESRDNIKDKTMYTVIQVEDSIKLIEFLD